MSTRVTTLPFFTPRQVPGLTAWYDAASLSTISTIVGTTTVTTWSNALGGASYSLTGGNAIYVANQYVQFNSTNPANGMSFNDANNIVQGRTFTAFFCEMRLMDGNTNNFLAGSPSGFQPNGNMIIGYPVGGGATNNTMSFDFNNNGISYTGPLLDYNAATENFKIWAFDLGGTQPGKTMVLNGSIIASGTNTATVNLWENPRIGQSFSTRGYVGRIRESLWFTPAINAAQRQQIEGYLAWKWNLQGVLPVNHPYRNSIIPPLQSPSTTLPMRMGFNGWTPTQIPNCQVWLDAGDTSSIIISGGSVSQWNDKSGNANNFTGENNPKSGTRRINGFNIMDITGGGYFYRNSFTFPARYSIFTVAFTSKASFATLLSTTPDVIFMMRDGSVMWGNSVPPWNSFNTTLPVTSNIVVTVTNNGSAGTLYANGTFIETKSGTTATGSRIGIGLRLTNSSENYNGYVCEIIIYNSVLTTDQRQQVEGYLAWKWGLTSSFALNYPFRFTIPPPVPLATYSTWVPTRLSSCSVWLDAADSNTLTTTGSIVTSWRDKSVNARTFTSTNSPTTGNTRLNGLNVINVTANGYFNTPSYPFPAAYSGFFVAYSPSANNAHTILSSQQDLILMIRWSQMYWGTGSGSWDSFLTNYSLTTPIVVSFTINNGGFFWRNGGSLLTGGSRAGGPATTTLGVGYRAGFADFWQGFIAEIILTNAPVSTSQRQQMEGYLAWKWGLQTSLPADHPFAKWPPPP